MDYFDSLNPEHPDQQVPDVDPLDGVFDGLESADPAAMSALLRENSALADRYGADERLMRRVRLALKSSDPPDRAAAIASSVRQRGVLTDVTSQLPPEKAVELYRKIAPMLAFGVLRRLDRNARLDTVQAIADHLCDEAVQRRLRASEHARDGIVEELCECLRDAGVKEVLDKDALLAVMEDCGATGDLMAMANCIRLSQVRAG